MTSLRWRARRAAVAVLAALLAVTPAAAGTEPAPAAARPDPRTEIGFDQKLGGALPLDAVFTDEAGQAVRLGDFFGQRPVVLSLVYHGCPMLCTVSLGGLVSALDVLTFDPGREFEIVTISFDASEGPALAAAKKKAYLARYHRPGAERGWHFLTGRQESIDRVTAAVGFRYVWDEPTRQFAHPAGIVVATPTGRIARYLFGIEYAPRDLRLALVESAEERIGNPVDQLLLACYRYDASAGRYSASILAVVRALAVLTVLALGGFIYRARRGERAAALRAAAP